MHRYLLSHLVSPRIKSLALLVVYTNVVGLNRCDINYLGCECLGKLNEGYTESLCLLLLHSVNLKLSPRLRKKIICYSSLVAFLLVKGVLFGR